MTPLLSSALLRTQSDARLAGLAGRGYELAFEAIVERYRKPLLRWCQRVLPEARAEDAVQQTFLSAWSAVRSGEEVADLRAWLYRIARNAALDNAKKSGYDYDELTDALRLAPGAAEDVERRTVMRETLAGVAGLPANQREALLRTAAGHSRADIARDLSLSEGAVRQLVHRARTTLRAAATAVTPLPLATWLAALGADAGASAAALKAGTAVLAAGVLAAGPGNELRKEVVTEDSGAAASSRAGDGKRPPIAPPAAVGLLTAGQRGGVAVARVDRRGRGSGERDDGSRERRSGDDSSGPGPGSEDRSGPSGSGGGEGSSGSGEGDSAGSGSSGSGSSGSGSSSSGSGSSGSGSDSSGSGSDSSGSGSSGSGSETSGSGDDSSGSGTSGSDSSGSGSGFDADLD